MDGENRSFHANIVEWSSHYNEQLKTGRERKVQENEKKVIDFQLY